MKFSILGLLALAAIAQSSSVLQHPTVSLLRIPHFDSAVIHSERLNNQFSYSTVENHAYAPVVQTYATYPWNIFQHYPQYPNVYYTPQQVYPTYTHIVQQNPSFVPGTIPSFGGQPPFGGHPQQPHVTDVEDPADNTAQNENLKQDNNNNNDDDTVAIESA